MTAPTLHYIHDPLCGWCYAAGPMVRAAEEAGIPIVLHGGGLWGAPTRIAADKRAYIREGDARIAALAGIPFGRAYLDGLLDDPDLMLWSRPVVAAVLAADAVAPGAAIAMLHAIQRAYYVEGRHVVDVGVLAGLAAADGIDSDGFATAMASVPIDAHIAASRALMQRAGLRGFPGFLVERDGEFARLNHEPFYGRPTAFAAAVTALAN